MSAATFDISRLQGITGLQLQCQGTTQFDHDREQVGGDRCQTNLRQEQVLQPSRALCAWHIQQRCVHPTLIV